MDQNTSHAFYSFPRLPTRLHLIVNYTFEIRKNIDKMM